MGRFEDKVALVTGGTSGIGRATALAFAREGAHVAIAGRRTDRLAEVSKAARALGVRALELPGDVREPAALADWEGRIRSEFGRVDCLVQAAGVLGAGTADDTTVEEWDRQMDTNVRAVFLATKVLTPLLRLGRDPAMVCVSSITAYRPYTNRAAYCASKAAVDMFTRCAALDLAVHGIRVNTVNPGLVRTEIHTVTGVVKNYAEYIEKAGASHPLGRVGEPEDVAAAILFLCSTEASWITGAQLAVDGGRGLVPTS
ncbi:MAG: SDR family oxidoreductase [Candidatus Eisenbacteria bacterium]|nr:SDR family oxidoreductase [Candidatus Eisenbacteria bacterium]